jgi:hypothetical protein
MDLMLDWIGLQLTQFLEFGYIFEANRTSLRGVSKLEPGERVELKDGKIRSAGSWYRPPKPSRAGSRERGGASGGASVGSGSCCRRTLDL